MSFAVQLFREAALLIVTPHCYDTYFVNFNFLDGPCFSATLSKCLGLGIIAFSFLVKLPQILKIYKNKSGQGISLSSVSLDLTAITIYASYSFLKGFPFSAWGDAVFLGIQTVTIAFLVLFYGGSTVKAGAYLAGYLLIAAALAKGLVPVEALWSLQGFNILIILTGRFIQVGSNYKNGHTGQLSAVTLIALFFGSAARIFTSIQETGDQMVILTYIASTSANLVLVLQLWWYWNVEAPKEKAE